MSNNQKSQNIIDFMKKFCKENREIILYLFFGGGAFIISMLSFAVLSDCWGINEFLANIISWVLCVIFSFFTNKVWVFNKSSTSKKMIGRQFIVFAESRVFTLLVEEVILYIGISLLQFESIFVKFIALVITNVVNYIISKYYIFIKN